MDQPLTLDGAGIAALLGCRVETVYRHIGTWRRDHGFPPPLPNSRLTSAAAVQAWINRGGTQAPPTAATTFEDDLAACEARLIGRAQRMLDAA